MYGVITHPFNSEFLKVEALENLDSMLTHPAAVKETVRIPIYQHMDDETILEQK